MRVARSFDLAVLPIAIEFTWRTFLIGLALFVMPPFAIVPSVEQHGLVFIAIVIWCYYDGALARGNWPRAVLEAGIWFFLATKWTQALLLFFGSTEAA
jgi:hypothetical protein